MTGPKDPGDDWGFPEVDPAGPASTRLPDADPAPEPEQYDTGSDAWWRAQAQAQRAAAAQDPVVPPSAPAPPEPVAPPELVEPSVLNAPSPLDEGWLPPDLPELRPPAPPAEELAAPEPDPVAPPAEEPQPVAGAPEPPPVKPTFASPPARTPEQPPTAEPVAAPPYAAEPAVPVADVDTDHHGIPVVEDPIWTGPSYDDVPRERTVEPAKVGVLRAVAGAGVAVAGVLLAVGALLLFGDDEPKGTPTVSAPPTASTLPTAQSTTEPTTQPTTSPTTAPTATVSPTPVAVAAPVVPVSVLNNSKVKNLAKRAAARFEAGGWPVAVQGNYRGGTIAQTTVYYAEGQRASAERFAKQFGIPRVAPRFPGLPTEGMTVVLTRDYAA